jgi:hypothetical protein
MDSFTAGTAVTYTVPLQDPSGNPLTFESISYRITDENGVELVPSTALTFDAGSDSAFISVTAAVNTLPAGSARGLRNIEMQCLDENGNTVNLRAAYVVELADPLVVGVNSFMTYTQAEFTAMSLPDLDSWFMADERSRIAALMDARAHIVQLSFTPLNSNVNWGQDSLNFIPEGTYSTDYVGNSNMFLFNGNLDLLRPEQFASLPTRFVDALKRAQVVEADFILGGNSIEQKRREGLIQDNIGESRQTFRQSRPLQLPVCRRALGYLSYFVTFAKRLGRM